MAAKIFITIGIIFIILGILIKSGVNFSWIGNLPGDIHIKKENFHFIFPIVTCLIASLILTLILWIVTRL